MRACALEKWVLCASHWGCHIRGEPGVPLASKFVSASLKLEPAPVLWNSGVGVESLRPE